MLKSNKLKLRAVEPEDLDLMYLIENDTELWPCGQASVPFSHYALKQYIAECSNDFFHDRQLRLVMNYEPLHHRAEVGIVVVPEKQRQGLATETLRLLASYVSVHLGIHLLYALVPKGNKASEALFKKCGYKETATLQDWLNSPKGWQSVVVFQQIL